MKKRNAIVSGLLSLLAIALVVLTGADMSILSPVPLQTPTTLPEGTYEVTKVTDGDTIKIEKDGKIVTIRMIGLDTPETVDPRRPVECFGKAASDKAQSLLASTTVTIETDPTQGMYDKYDRLLAYVYLPDGTLFNKYMIQEGYGHEYTYNIPYKYRQEFKAAENSARTAKKGLWADDACPES